MFCPKCKAEYRVGFIRCSDCDVELVDDVPVETPVPKEVSRDFESDRFEAEPKLVIVRTYQSGLDADLAKTVLEAAGIESMIRGDDIARRYYIGLPLTQRVELLVRAEDAEDAEKILDVDATDGDEPVQD